MKKVLILIFWTVSIMSLQAESIRVAVAANVGYAISDIVDRFKSINPNIKVQTTLGGTGKLVTQILHGAPYDILLAADMLYPKALHSDGMTVAKPKVYARGSLILLSPKKRDLSLGVKMLASNEIQRVAIANPKTAPYGRASFEVLEKAGLLPELRSKLVYGESISQTVTFAVRAADVGIVSKSSIYAPQMSHYRTNDHWIDIDSSLYSPIDQGVVLLKRASNNKHAKKFYEFIFSDEAKKIFKQYGYMLP